MSKQKALNIFVHLPKTAGERINCNIEASLPKGSYIDSSHSYFVQYYDIKQKRKRFYEGKDHFESYIQALTERQKAKIRCIGGHDSYDGIHKLFVSHPKYMVFLRDPVARTLSLYNYERMICKNMAGFKGVLNLCQQKALERSNLHFLIEGREPSFEEWLMGAYDKKISFYYTMTRYLQHLGFLADACENSIKEALQKFYFIGITEQYDEDALFLYHEIGIKKFDSDAHVSTPYIRANDLDSSVIKKIKELNEKDIFLYQSALQINKKFKQSNSYFYLSIKKMQKKQKFFYLKKDWRNRFISFLNIFWDPFKKYLKQYSWCVYLNRKIKQSFLQQD